MTANNVSESSTITVEPASPHSMLFHHSPIKRNVPCRFESWLSGLMAWSAYAVMIFCVSSPLGDVAKTSLESIWRGQKLAAARRLLYAKDRGFVPCERCNHHAGMRVGLLADPGPVQPGDKEMLQ